MVMAETGLAGSLVEGADDGDTVPLSPKEPLQNPQFRPQAKSSAAAATPGEEDLNEVDPFTFKPSFTVWDKILVSFR